MRVCHVTSVHCFNDNRIFYKEVLSLKEAGYDICYIAPNAPSQFEGVRIYSNRFSGGRVKRFFVQSIFYTIRHCLRAWADVYHFHDPELMPTAFLIRCMGRQVIFDVHENVPAAILSKSYLKSLFVRKAVSRLMDIGERSFFLFYSRIVTARPDISQRLARFSPTTLRNFPTLPSQVELDRQLAKIHLDKPKRSIIYVGGMAAIRGNYELVEAFDRLDEFELWLLGPIDSEDFASKMRESLGWRNVRYFGVVEPNEIFGYIKNADAGVITFWPEPNHIRTLATKPFEYMACGLPMIMSDFEYWRDFFGSGSLYVNPKDPDDIADAVRALLTNDALMQEMGRANRVKAQAEYNWYSERERLYDVYSSLRPA